MKFVFLNPNDPPGHKIERNMSGDMGILYKRYKYTDPTYFFPLTATYVLSALLDEGCDFKYIDGQADIPDEDTFVNAIHYEKPDFIFSLVSFASLQHDLSVLEKIKNLLPNCRICTIGGACIIIPEEILKNPAIDYIIQGRYPFYNHIRELCSLVKNNEDFEKCHGLTYYRNGILTKNTWNTDNDLNKLNFKSFHIINMQKYVQTTRFPDGTSLPLVTILPSVGCHYGCIYCPYPVTNGKIIIFKNINKIIEEIRYFKDNFNISGFYFRSIAIDKERKFLISLCNEIIKNKLDIKWIFEVRVDQMDEEILKLMSRAGCVRLDFGVETGSDEILKSIGKPGLDRDKIRTVFGLCKKYGIFPMAQLIIGLLGETKETIKETQKFLEEIDPVFVNFNICIPYPGTPLFKIAKAKGLIEDFNFSHYMSHSAVMRTEALTRKDLERAEKGMRRRQMLRQFMQSSFHRKRILNLASQKILG
jgi:radical SAM superfamily enzyme YgiQ (UPF0313 family)